MSAQLNEVLVSPRTGTWYYCSGCDRIWDAEEFIDFLLAESASKLYIPAWEAEIMKLNLDKMSNLSKAHIELVDQNKKTYSNIKSIMKDISNGLDWKVDNIDNENLGFSLNRVFEFIYHLQLSLDYRVDCDVSRPNLLNQNFIELIQNTNEKEAISLLNEIKGVLNLYSPTEVECNISIVPVHEKVKIRMDDIMIDSTFLQLSECRRKIANTGDIKLYPRIKLLARRLTMKKIYRKSIGLAKLPMNLALPNTNITPKKMKESIFYNRDFSPPIVDLTRIAEIGFCGGQWSDSGLISEMGYPENAFDNITNKFLWWEKQI